MMRKNACAKHDFSSDKKKKMILSSKDKKSSNGKHRQIIIQDLNHATQNQFFLHFNLSLA